MIKIKKKSQIVGSLDEKGAGSGSESIPMINGSGSERPKNMWIRAIQTRIRIRNTAFKANANLV
jgi:hypothetical protein